MTATLERPRPNGLKPAPIAEQVVFVEPSLRESFGKREIGERDLMVMGIIDSVGGIHLPQKRDIYFYHLWQENRETAFQRVKSLVGEVREDELERVRDRVDSNNFLIEKYEEAHAEFVKQTLAERIPEFMGLLKAGEQIDVAAQEADIDNSEAFRIRLQAIRTGELQPSPRGKYKAKQFRQFRRKVKKLYEQGLSMGEIAIKLGRNNGSKVQEAISSLKQEGVLALEPRKAAMRRRYREQHSVREEILAVYLAEKPSIKELAKRFNLPVSTILNHEKALRREGRITGRRIEHRQQIKDEIRKGLEEHLANYPGEPMAIFSHFKGINNVMIIKIYDEIALEQEVPPLRIRQL